MCIVVFQGYTDSMVYFYWVYSLLNIYNLLILRVIRKKTVLFWCYRIDQAIPTVYTISLFKV